VMSRTIFKNVRCRSCSHLTEQPEPDDADRDEVDRDDVVEEPRHHQDEDAGEERDDGLQVADADGHGSLRDASPGGRGRDGVAVR